MNGSGVGITALTVIGSAAQGVGILKVAGRWHEAVRHARSYASHVEAQHRHLAAHFVARKPVPWLPRTVQLRGLDAAVSVEGALSLKVKYGEPPTDLPGLQKWAHEQMSARRNEIRDVNIRIDRLAAGLPDQLTEAAKDSWVGVAWLALGLACLAAAGVWGALA